MSSLPERHRHGNGSHRRRHRRRSSTDPYLVCLASMAVSCVLMVLTLLITGPQWETALMGAPLGSYLMGGLGGLITLGIFPSWARRLSPDASRVPAITAYRLLVALAAGALGHSLVTALLTGDPGGVLPYAAALTCGVLERPVNDGVLRALGVLAPGEETPPA